LKADLFKEARDILIVVNISDTIKLPGLVTERDDGEKEKNKQ
jgi:hypothetical protein